LKCGVFGPFHCNAPVRKVTGSYKQMGDLRGDQDQGPEPDDLRNKKFGRLTVHSYNYGAYNGAHWLCICDCGKVTIASASNLKRGKHRSCGCARWGPKGRDHGGKYPPEYQIWIGMKNRCHNPTDSSYDHYGGRGIYVCDSWRSSFAQFMTDMGPRPTLKHSIERRDNNQGYNPDNCYWATHSEQMKNRRKKAEVRASRAALKGDR